jgi:hypothetical protein
VSEAFMTIMAALVPHFIIGIALAAGLFGMFMLSEGFFILKNDIPNYWYARRSRLACSVNTRCC